MRASRRANEINSRGAEREERISSLDSFKHIFHSQDEEEMNSRLLNFARLVIQLSEASLKIWFRQSPFLFSIASAAAVLVSGTMGNEHRRADERTTEALRHQQLLVRTHTSAAFHTKRGTQSPPCHQHTRRGRSSIVSGHDVRTRSSCNGFVPIWQREGGLANGPSTCFMVVSQRSKTNTVLYLFQ